MRVGAGLLDAVLVDVERGAVLRDAVLEDDAFLVVAIGVYSYLSIPSASFSRYFSLSGLKANGLFPEKAFPINSKKL